MRVTVLILSIMKSPHSSLELNDLALHFDEVSVAFVKNDPFPELPSQP